MEFIRNNKSIVEQKKILDMENILFIIYLIIYNVIIKLQIYF